MSLNEKTLELNITHEFLTFCRKSDPHSFALGTTLRQEGASGYDSRLLGALPTFWRTAIFQYKRAWDKRTSYLGEEYHFEINNNGKRDQHWLLHLMAGGQPDIAYYVFPLCLTPDEIRLYSPNLLSKTLFADAIDIPMALIKFRSHDVLVYPKARTAVVRSERLEIKLRSFEELQQTFEEGKFGFEIERLFGNIRDRNIEDFINRTKFPRFHFLIFPREEEGKKIHVSSKDLERALD